MGLTLRRWSWRLRSSTVSGEVRVLVESDTDYLAIYDEEHSDDEDRFLATGPIAKGMITVRFDSSRA